jgi:hypothetical protein
VINGVSNNNPAATASVSNAALNSQAVNPSAAIPSQNPSLTALHQAPTQLKNYRLRKISAEDQGLDPAMKNLLIRHNVFKEDKYKYNNAVISEDGNTLVLAVNGRTLLANYFGGTGMISRFFNRVIGFFTGIFGRADKFIAAKKYKELYNQPEQQALDGERGESLAELRAGLNSNHYHGTIVYEKDPKTGAFEKKPKAIGITDAYMLFVRPQIKLIKPDATEEEIKSLEQKFRRYYSLDKVIPLFGLEDKVDFNEIRHKIIEGLYQAQGFDLLAVPSQIDPNPNSNTNDLNYRRINWNDIRQMNNGEWKLIKDNRSITLVRPLDKAQEPLPKEIAILDAISQTSSGDASRLGDQEITLMQEAAKLNEVVLNH